MSANSIESIPKIVIIDSGLAEEHQAYNNVVAGMSFEYVNENSIIKKDNYTDENGHGTAVFDCIHKEIPNAQYYIIKVFDGSLICDENMLVYALEYVNKNIDCDIINLSLGLLMCEDKDKLYKICQELREKNTVIISAYDNNGAISYPAAFDCVIGVDSSPYCKNINMFYYVENSIINIIAKGGIQRVAWKGRQFNFVYGTSFAAAHITAFIAKQYFEIEWSFNSVLNILRTKAVKIISFSDLRMQNKLLIRKAIAFPCNKEIHSLINFNDLLGFTLINIYDVKISGNVGKLYKSNYFLDDSFIIGDINELDWSGDFDTVILGHVKELERLTGKQIVALIIEKCVECGKNIYSFDSLEEYGSLFYNKINVIWPKVEKVENSNLTMGKMFSISAPVLSVFGTSSKQGKFSLQLFLRRCFLNDGYMVGQLGTEPSSLLFGMDEIYPMGYNSTVQTQGFDSVLMINQMMAQIDNKKPDIILTGSQSGTTVYWTGNIAQYPVAQLEFLMGIMPDAVVLCINAHDDDDYILRTINVIKGISYAKVIAIAIFPMYYPDDWSYVSQRKKALSDSELEDVRIHIKSITGIDNCYVIGQKDGMTKLYECCIEFFNTIL